MKQFLFPLILILIACGHPVKERVVLKKPDGQREVIVQMDMADYYFGREDLIAYCEDEDDGEDNDFPFQRIIHYIENYPGDPVVIPDTIGTQLEVNPMYGTFEKDSLRRAWIPDHPYSYMLDKLGWAIIDFAREGNLRIYDKQQQIFLDTIIVFENETEYHGSTDILLPNDSVLYWELKWIR